LILLKEPFSSSTLNLFFIGWILSRYTSWLAKDWAEGYIALNPRDIP